MARVPSLRDLRALLTSVQRQIDDDCRADIDDDTPGIQVTVGWSDETGAWSYQTGDNSFTGGAYGYPHWAVVSVYRCAHMGALARDIQDQLRELAAQ